ncbi:MAG: fatty acid desaturase CarF family protein [Longimicrobiales bacterium]
MTDSVPPPMVRSQSPAFTIVKALAYAVALTLIGLVGAQLTASVRVGPSLAVMAGGLVLGYLLADLLSGTVHWFCDTFFAEDTPLIGRMLIQPFRDHHRYPQAIARYGVLYQDASFAFIVILPLALVWRAGGPHPGAWSMFGHAVLWSFAIGSLGTNLFHKWAHAERVPAGVRWLQQLGLILSPRAHHVHHSTYTGGYCVTSGRLNAGLDRIAFFARLERLIRGLLHRPRTTQPLSE